MARQSLDCEIDLTYGVYAVEKLDVFHAAPSQAASHAGAPVRVFIHGGYWRSLDKSDHSF